MRLFPTFDVPTIAERPETLAADYKESVYFDMSTGDIVLDGTGRVKMANSRDAWLQWCMKMIASERGTLRAYPSAKIGVEMEPISELPDRASKESAIETTIKEALMNDPSRRTVDVNNFEFVYGVDSMHVTFDIIGADGYTGGMTVEVEV